MSEFFFGQGFYEADVGDRFTFIYTYGNGDAYMGYIYASPSYGSYYPGWQSQALKLNETGQAGSYKITGMSYTGAAANSFGQVFVDTYYDGESKKNYKPVGYGKAVGTNYLWSESDYIIRANVPDYRFGQGWWEADVGDRFSLVYSYGNGDAYAGYVYASPGYGYYPGWQSYKKTNETGQAGFYRITGMSYTGAAASLYGQVLVNTYYDGETRKNYWPAHRGQAVGTRYLWSELDYIIKTGVPVYQFGQGWWDVMILRYLVSVGNQ